ncbi:YbaN family protein [Alkaliflexus imshenetskii]|uniref:YbaN family protein n=1 Tax=Alkaliflexus imshenetskii TaxID=286730 RepID=UPI00047C0EDC|nr:YbaN family protein [Alkaliflexus imshenetskii]
MLKVVFIVLGALSLVLGVLGILIPGLPTTPFLLLTAALWMKSSEKLHNRLLSNKYLGPYIVNYEKRKGLTVRQKRYAILSMWILISLSFFLLSGNPSLQLILIFAGITGAATVWYLVPNGKNED